MLEAMASVLLSCASNQGCIEEVSPDLANSTMAMQEARGPVSSDIMFKYVFTVTVTVTVTDYVI